MTYITYLNYLCPYGAKYSPEDCNSRKCRTINPLPANNGKSDISCADLVLKDKESICSGLGVHYEFLCTPEYSCSIPAVMKSRTPQLQACHLVQTVFLKYWMLHLTLKSKNFTLVSSVQGTLLHKSCADAALWNSVDTRRFVPATLPIKPYLFSLQWCGDGL